jgi:hypothetical protein
MEPPCEAGPSATTEGLTDMDVSMIVQLLKLSQGLWDWAKENKLASPVQDQQIATASIDLLKATEAGKILLEKIEAMPEEETDKLWEEMLAHRASSQPTEPEK